MKKNLIKLLAIGAGITLMSAKINAQNQQERVHVKIIKNINGVETITDTLIGSGELGYDIQLSNLNIDSILKADGIHALNDKETSQTIIKKIACALGDSSKIDTLIQNTIKEHLHLSEKDASVVMVKKISSKNINETSASEKQSETTEVKIILKQQRLINLSEADKQLLGKEANSLGNRLKVEQVNFYPNPNNGKFNLNFNLENTGNTEVAIFNVEGKKVFEEQLKDFSGTYNKEIDISRNAKGVYFIKVTQEKNTFLKKLIIE